MRKPEQRLWDRLRASAPPDFLLERIENVVGTGRPDVDLLVDGRVWNIELKAREEWPVRKDTPVLGRTGLSLAQRNWHLKRLRHGGRICTLIRVSGTYIVIFMTQRSVDLINFMNADELVLEAEVATTRLSELWQVFR